MEFPRQYDAYAKPPVDMRKLYKNYQKHLESLDDDLGIVDFRRGLTAAQQTNITAIGRISKERLTSTFNAFVQGTHPLNLGRQPTNTAIINAPIYEHRHLPGRILDGLNL